MILIGPMGSGKKALIKIANFLSYSTLHKISNRIDDK